MAGEGEVIPNGSIHWHIRHDKTPAPGNPWPNPPNTPPAGPLSQQNGILYGIDNKPVSAGDKFTVTLRFKDQNAAGVALASMQSRPQVGGPAMWELVFEVPMVQRTQSLANGAPQNPYAQIRYEW
jgi:hypothetical protein